MILPVVVHTIMSTSTQHMLVIQHVPSTPNQTIVVDQCLQIAAAFVCARKTGGGSAKS